MPTEGHNGYQVVGNFETFDREKCPCNPSCNDYTKVQ
jgi:hypothetical protein